MMRIDWVAGALATLLFAGVAGCGGGGSGGGSTPPLPRSTPTVACGAIVYDGSVDGFGREAVVNSGQVSAPTDIAFIPGSTTAFVVIDQSGFVNYFNGGCDRVNRVDLRGDIASGGIGVAAVGSEEGLLNVEFHPNYATNRYVFFYYTSLASTVNSVTRMTVSFIGGQLVLNDPQRIIDFRKADVASASNHNGGGMVFAPDGTLLASVGDGGADNTSAQANNRLLGKVIRVQPSLTVNTGGYSIPSGNMFDPFNSLCSNIALSGQDCPEILTKGLRNPFRMSRDANIIYLGDVGAGTEEINSFNYTTTANFGWPTHDGYAASSTLPGYRNPIVYYARDDATATAFRSQDPMGTAAGSGLASVMIGDVYRGSRYSSELNSGALMFGDFYDGFIRAVGVNASGGIIGGTPPGFHLVHATAISSMVQGPDGYLYLTALYGPAAVYRLVRP